MLNFLRHAAKTWAFKALFAVLIVSFAIWGIGDVSLGGAGNRVATVGDETVTVEDYAMALQREMRSLSQRLERPVTMDEAEAGGVPQALLARLARDAALNDEARRLGISADDGTLREAITSSPSFQGPDGAFDKQQYEFVLNQLGFDVDRFENDMRRSLARDAIARAVSGGAAAAPGYAATQLAPRLEKRALGLIVLDAETQGEAPETPDEAALRAWFDENADSYVAPERRDLVWIEISPATLVSEVEVPEEELRAAYDAAGDRYDIPERRVVDRLGFADTAAAMAAKAEIEAGEKTFADLAAEKDLTLDDVTLGEVSRETIPAEFADAAFEGELGVKGPVSTPLGPALVNVRAILPARSIPFEEARAELHDELAAGRSADLAAERAEQAADLIAGGATLEEVAEETGLTLRRAEAVTREGAGLEGAAASPSSSTRPSPWAWTRSPT